MYVRNRVIALAENHVSLTSCTWLPSTTSSRENVPFAEHKYNYTCTMYALTVQKYMYNCTCTYMHSNKNVLEH